MNLKEEIQSIVKGEVVDDEATLVRYSRDASIFEVQPRLVVFPKDREDLKNLVVFSQKNGVSLTCRGGGSDMTGGPLTESIVVDMQRHFNKILAQPAQGWYAVVQPGVWYRDFEREAAKRNLLLPCFPASKELCTLGGMVANNAGGEKTLAYGKTDRYVQELKVVLADGNEYTVKPLSREELTGKLSLSSFEGEVYRRVFAMVQENEELLKSAKPKVSKNSAGYALWNIWDKEKGIFDMTKLFVGSQGTLGVITEIRFRLVSQTTHSSLLIVFLKDQSLLAEATQAILKEKPESFELYDDHTLKLAARFFLDFVKTLKGNIFSLGLE
ncbi:MAG: putative oxidoreductase [Parcubacteria group bacterium Greene0416_39]|nr:MAG: putative oxidoreductase [Parcubacteria group bacterium Greene0416_39]